MFQNRYGNRLIRLITKIGFRLLTDNRFQNFSDYTTLSLCIFHKCHLQCTLLLWQHWYISFKCVEMPRIAQFCTYFWPDCKAIPAYGLMMSVCLSVRPSVRLSTFWLTSAFKFVLGRINHYRLDTLHWNRPWWDLLNCDLSLWPWPWLFLFKVT